VAGSDFPPLPFCAFLPLVNYGPNLQILQAPQWLHLQSNTHICAAVAPLPPPAPPHPTPPHPAPPHPTPPHPSPPDGDWLQESNKDPSALVASGTPILVRVYVPLWLVNATTLPVSALVVEINPPPKPSKEGEAAPRQLLDAAESIKPKVVETKIRPAGGRWLFLPSLSMLCPP